ncbi:MAG: heme-binding protein [Candidatus Verstraetearchaeota archaeon]|nr:heme-binding protein [Candidatus Verstraetearchaeota archaeon]
MVEEPKYEVLKKIGDVEIRRYPSLVVATAMADGEDPFSLLFGYISGKNRQRSKVPMISPVISEKIPMTSPVISDSSSLSFILPSEYRLDTAPEPIDGNVRLSEIPARVLGVIRFSGKWSSNRFREKSGELLGALKGAGLRTVGEPFAMLYNPPYVPWFLRRNEVAVELEPPAQT